MSGLHDRSRDTSPAEAGATPQYDIVRSADVVIRNYDHQRGYDLDLRAVAGGETVFERRYSLPPGEVERESYVLPSGTYEVGVTLEHGRRRRLTCRIDSAPTHTALVEVGNGGLSLTEGLRGR